MGATGARLMLVAAAMLLVVVAHMVPSAEGSALRMHTASDVVTEIEFWHKFNLSGYKVVFGVQGEFGEGATIDYSVLDASDNEIGRARGLGISDALDGYGVQELFTDTFTGGTYAGSALTFGGHWNQTLEANELAVIGGTGVFRFATGSALFSQEVRDSGTYFHVTGELQGVSSTTSLFRKGGSSTTRLASRLARH
eukprot:TRINITY_DN431_c0_g2_i2.p2 TRINITY_DN431_c0_g2~~TRINITY_DN431_c0_g2_i2.p2  ORF type:complete len:196 (+),score=4.17 TRINITY_DN431_c0_g2_i2:93-680(+)